MQYLIIILCSLFACSKVTFQGRLAKGNIQGVIDSVFANCLLFAIISIMFSVSALGGINPGVVPYSIIFGVLSAGFQVFYALALQSGPFSATCMMVNLNIFIPVVVAAVCLGEKVTAFRVAGIILCIFALYLNMQKDGRKINFKWIVYVFMAFLCTGTLSASQKFFAKSEFGVLKEQYIFLGYLIAFFVALIVFLIMRGTKQPVSFKINRKTVTVLICIAASLGAYQYCTTYANSIIDAIVLNPASSGLTTIFQMISGRILFKDKFTKRRILAICVGVAAIVLISL